MTAPHVLHARDELDLLNAVPYLLGFHPQESLVLLVLAEGRVKALGRADVADLERPDQLAELFGPLLRRFRSADVVVAAYCDDPAAAWELLEWASELVGERFWGVQVSEGLVFAAPWQVVGVYAPQASALAAEATYCGLPALPSRSSLGACLEPVDRQAGEEALHEMLNLPPQRAVERALVLAVQHLHGDEQLQACDAVTLALAAHSPAFAECIVLGLERSNADAAVALWSAVVRATPPRAGGGACLMLGFAAWLAGNGALTNLCLERLGDALEQSAVRRFLEVACATALPPEEWVAIRADWLAETEAA